MYVAQNQYRIVLKVEKSGSKWLQVGERRNDCYVYGRIWTYNRCQRQNNRSCEVPRKQGRILIPSVLREFASLQKDVVFVGVGSRIEIWSKESWNDSISNYDDNMDEVAENMDSLGFTI